MQKASHGNIYKITKSSTCFFVFLLIFFIAIAYLVSTLIFNFGKAQFTSIETIELNNDIDVFSDVEKTFIDSYQTLLIDYSEWDDSYEFVNSPSNDYLESNFDWEYLEQNLGINFVSIIDMSNTVLYTDAFDSEIGALTIEGINPTNSIYIDDLINRYEDNNQSYLYIDSDYGLLLLLVNEITDSMSELESNGYMFFGILMDDHVLFELSSRSSLSVSYVSNDVPREVQEFYTDTQSWGHYKYYSEDKIDIYYEMHLPDGELQFLKLGWNRSIYELGIFTVSRARIVIFSFLLFILLSGAGYSYKRNQHSLYLQEIALRDHLTGLHNRRYYESKLDNILDHYSFPITIIMSDINGLKLVNDAFGHLQGDILIKKAAAFLSDSLQCDGFVSRLGGDEFAIVINGTSEEAENYIARVKKKASGFNTEGIVMSIAFGYATLNSSSDNIYELSRTAEDAMYRQKLLEIPSMRSNAIDTILTTLYEKDSKSEEHSRRVSQFSLRIAELLNLSSNEKSNLQTAGLVHDIGKIIISTRILKKEGRLTNAEYASIKTHPEIGFRILNSISGMRDISKVILGHHERWDGTGYPQQLRENGIPYLSRILAIADAYDAMVSTRSYNKTFTKEEAYEELKQCSGTQFDPAIIKVIVENKEQFLAEQTNSK